MGNKFKDFHNVDSDFGKVVYHEDYCSFCGGWISKMVNHKIAHKLKHRMMSDVIPNNPDEPMQLLNSYAWYSQDRTKPAHLRPEDPRLKAYLEKESKLKSEKNDK